MVLQRRESTAATKLSMHFHTATNMSVLLPYHFLLHVNQIQCAFRALQTVPALSPSVNMINPPPFWGENGARFWQRTDSVCLLFFWSVYLTVMRSLLNENPDGHMVIHWRLTMELTMWPGRNLRWKWCERDSDVAHAFTRKSIWVGSRIEDSPGTTSNPDGAVSVAVSSGRGVTTWAVDADGVVVTVILIVDQFFLPQAETRLKEQ